MHRHIWRESYLTFEETLIRRNNIVLHKVSNLPGLVHLSAKPDRKDAEELI